MADHAGRAAAQCARALIVDACLRLGYTVITIATLGFLGLGLPPPDPDWGQMIAEAVPVGVFAIMPC